MKVIMIEPGKEPELKNVRQDERMGDVLGGAPVQHILEGLHLEAVTNGEAERQGLAETGALNLGAASIRVKGRAMVCRVRTHGFGGYTDARPCDLALIRACWVPAVERIEERSRRECD